MTNAFVSTDIPDLYERHGDDLVHIVVNGNRQLATVARVGLGFDYLGPTTLTYQEFVVTLAKCKYDLRQAKVLDAYDSINDAITTAEHNKALLTLVQTRHLKIALKALAEYEAEEEEAS